MSAGTLPSQPPEGSWEPRFLGLLWGNRGSPPQLLSRVRNAIDHHAPRLRMVLKREGCVLFADAAATQVQFNAVGGLIVLGTLFDPSGAPADGLLLERLGKGTCDASIDSLFSGTWGNYVAIARDNETGDSVIARDPSGGLTAHVIDAGGVAVVCDELPRWLVTAIDRPMTIDAQALAQALATPITTTHRSLLHHVVTVSAGSSIRWRSRFFDGRKNWDPAAFYKRGENDPTSLRTAVLDAVRAYRALHRDILLELSGGLDSAIVLGALAAEGDARGLKCVNFATTYAGGDERATARDAAERAGVELIEVIAREEDVDYRTHLAQTQPVQPQLYGLDPVLETAVSGLADAFGSSAIFTGQGGDAVFYQMPTDKVAIDFMRNHGAKGLFSSAAMDAAKRIHSSIWRVQWRMIRDRFAGTRPDRMPAVLGLLGPAARERLDPTAGDHPWLSNAADLPPGKRLQLLAIANCQLFNGPTRRRQHSALIHPLLSQPVVEACLRIPSYELSYGTMDRALARALFSDLLPPSIAKRRGKGETSSYYRRAIIGNLDFLRAHLLEGTLAANGFLDSDALDALMTEQAVIWNEEARMLAILASFESWARYWRL